MKNLKYFLLCSIIFVIFISCVSANKLNNVDKDNKDLVYQEIQNEIEKLDAFKCRDFLANYISENTYVTARLKEERGNNWGILRINSPFNASADIYINTYRYRRNLKDPREIYYLLHKMQTCLQFEAVGTKEIKTKSKTKTVYLKLF